MEIREAREVLLYIVYKHYYIYVYIYIHIHTYITYLHTWHKSGTIETRVIEVLSAIALTVHCPSMGVPSSEPTLPSVGKRTNYNPLSVASRSLGGYMCVLSKICRLHSICKVTNPPVTTLIL